MSITYPQIARLVKLVLAIWHWKTSGTTAADAVRQVEAVAKLVGVE